MGLRSALKRLDEKLDEKARGVSVRLKASQERTSKRIKAQEAAEKRQEGRQQKFPSARVWKKTGWRITRKGRTATLAGGKRVLHTFLQEADAAQPLLRYLAKQSVAKTPEQIVKDGQWGPPKFILEKPDSKGAIRLAWGVANFLGKLKKAGLVSSRVTAGKPAKKATKPRQSRK